MDDQNITLEGVDEGQDIFADSTDELQKTSEKTEVDKNEHKMSFSGEALSEQELYSLSARKDTRIIYILGSVGSGKTTFETMLYESFFSNKDEELLFAGSETLLGYEKRLYYLRVESGSSNPKMERTSVKDNHCFLHLNVFNSKRKEEQSIVFTDISGEIFESCISKKLEMEEKLAYLDMAHNIVLFMDGEKLIDHSQRQSVVNNIKLFLKTFRTSSLYHNNCRIDLVISKNDIIFDYLKNHTDTFIEKLEEKFEAFKEDFDIHFIRIEAMNGSDLLDKEISIPLIDVLKYWLERDEQRMDSSLWNKEQIIYKNEFNRFGAMYGYGN